MGNNLKLNKMKRFKTKQEFKNEYGDGWRRHSGWASFLPSMDYLIGLPQKSIIDSTFMSEEWMLTTEPHPFNNLDIKVRVTPKQSKKLQKKAFKMGYSWGMSRDVYVKNTDVCYLQTNKGRLTCTREITIFNGWKECEELTYKQFMNGTVPKKVKEFKVGDWVEVVSRGKGVYPGFSHDFEIGKIGEITSLEDNVFRLNGSQFCTSEDLKHTTKQPEEKLMFKGYEVKMEDDMYRIGCKTMEKSEIEAFYNFYKYVLKGDATADEAIEFISANETKLGL